LTIKFKKHPEYQSPIVVFNPPLPLDDVVYSKQDERFRSLYEESRNPLYVMEAFFRRFADITTGRDTPSDTVSFPVWMVQPIADMFEVFYSNLILEDNARTSLDNCAKISKSHKKEFNSFKISADRIIDEAYNLMWHFGINRTIAIELTFELMEERAHIDSGDGASIFSFPVSVDTVIQYADRGGKLKTYEEWLEENGQLKKWLNEDGSPMLDEHGIAIPDTIYQPSEILKRDFLKYIGCVSNDLRNRILQTMS